MFALAYADGADPTDPEWQQELGHDLGMMATGSGVSWSDDHEVPDGLDLRTAEACSGGVGWAEDDSWYNRPIIRHVATFADGTTLVYAFPPSATAEDVAAAIADDFGLPISIVEEHECRK